MSRDPLIIPRTASSTNPYAFALNDPINLSDPSGLDPGLGLCATSSGGPCGGTGDASLGVGVALGIGIGLATSWGGSGGSGGGPAGPSLLSKDAFDTAPIAMWPQWQSRDFLDRFAGRNGYGSFDAYLDGIADGISGAKESTDSINPGLFPIVGTTSLFLDGGLQLVRGIKDERNAARRGDTAGMYAARGEQAIGVGKSLVAIASVVGPAAEVGATVRAGAGVASAAEGGGVTTFYRGMTWGEASEVVQNQALDASRIAANQRLNPGAAGSGAYLTSQEKAAVYFGEIAGHQGRGLGPAVVRMDVPTSQFSAFAARRGISVETPIPRMPFPATETLIPMDYIAEFNSMCTFCFH